jgi:hypothetical protein
MKKVFALLLVLALLLTFGGCRKSTTESEETSYYEGDEGISSGGGDVSSGDGSGKNTSDGEVAQPGKNSVISDPLKSDLKGATVTVYDVGDIFTPDASKSKTDAARAELIKKLQKELNCKFDVKKTELKKLMSLAAASAASGKAISQIIVTDLSRTGYFISSNLAADMGKISSMDLSKDYMNVANMPEATRFGSGRYAVAGDSTVGSCVVYNKRILKELGHPDNYIYDLVDSGKWTYTEFRKLAKEATKDLDGKSGMSMADQWGIAIMDRSTAGTADLLVSANTPMIKLVNGKLVSNMSDPNIFKVAGLMRDTYRLDGTTINDNGAKIDGTKAHDAFKTGNVFMEYTTTEVIPLYSSMKDEFGLVPTPKIDGAKNYSCALDWNYKGIMIPAGLSAKDQYNAGAVVQAYMYLMQDIKKEKKNEYVNRYLCDAKSGENFDTVIRNVSAQPAQCYAEINETVLSGTYRVFWNYLAEGTSVSDEVESTSSSLKKALDDLNTKIKDK